MVIEGILYLSLFVYLHLIQNNIIASNFFFQTYIIISDSSSLFDSYYKFLPFIRKLIEI